MNIATKFFHIAMATTLVTVPLSAQQPQLPSGLPPGLYDESRVAQYALPDPLLLRSGEIVQDVHAWRNTRRPEILNLFATEVYGRTMAGRPPEMKWQFVSMDQRSMHDSAETKVVRIFLLGK